MLHWIIIIAIVLIGVITFFYVKKKVKESGSNISSTSTPQSTDTSSKSSPINYVMPTADPNNPSFMFGGLTEEQLNEKQSAQDLTNAGWNS